MVGEWQAALMQINGLVAQGEPMFGCEPASLLTPKKVSS
jgi:hypothetical protein